MYIQLLYKVNNDVPICYIYTKKIPKNIPIWNIGEQRTLIEKPVVVSLMNMRYSIDNRYK